MLRTPFFLPSATLSEKAIPLDNGYAKPRILFFENCQAAEVRFMKRFNLFAAVFICPLFVLLSVSSDADAQAVAATNFSPANETRQAVSPERKRLVENAVDLPNTIKKNFANLARLERKAFDLINQKRLENGLAELNWSEKIAEIARIHSENMANFKFFSHRGLDGMMVDDRADRFGLKKWRAIGENIAYNRGYDNPAEFAVLRWMQSPSHRENLLNAQWKETAVGVAVAADGAVYFTQVFIK